MVFKKGHPKYTNKGDFKKGHATWNKGLCIFVAKICLSCGKSFELHKDQVERGKGKYCSKECFNKSMVGRVAWNKVKKLAKVCPQCSKSFEVRPCENYRKFCSKMCVDNSRKGVKRPPFTEEWKQKIGEANKLVPHPRGENHPHWKGGITPLIYALRSLDEYNQWRMDCLKRDWFRCQDCGSKENLIVHHIQEFKEILATFLKEYDQFNPIEDRETLIRLAIKYEPFWNVNNGKTLCEKCHNSIREKIWDKEDGSNFYLDD